ncbi:MAG: phospho-N-acetylmuramoyl-pentapeptide-transferase [Clostridiales bacterium]|nr:phospho-N-acetylmuramoyl-pentapeptide-transferase [Clostridiales bacterium]MBQ2769258.1 phospho-N-acetylmuramoyl-pentapeptide-transferase [Clostridia bacterium]
MKTYLGVALLAFVLSLVFCFLLIPILRKLKAGQNILVYVEEHKQKGGTPTMGGIAFVLAAVLSSVLFIDRANRTVVLCFAIGLSYMAVGLIDDLLKRRHKENLGLTALQKFAFQILIAVFSAIYAMRAGLTALYLPFINKTVDIGWGMFPLAILVLLATVNAVNLTDGLDGLAAGTSVPFFIVLGALISVQSGLKEFSLLSFALSGALLAYLLFNVSPASVFMGDTGSLALGGFASALALFSSNALYILTVGVCFVFSVISVVLQVIYYKATGGKRIFLMAPVHHHFQKKGFSEARISYAYFAITLCLGGAYLWFAL